MQTQLLPEGLGGAVSRHQVSHDLRGGASDEASTPPSTQLATCRTINVAGLRGFWKLLHLLPELQADELPEVIFA